MELGGTPKRKGTLFKSRCFTQPKDCRRNDDDGDGDGDDDDDDDNDYDDDDHEPAVARNRRTKNPRYSNHIII